MTPDSVGEIIHRACNEEQRLPDLSLGNQFANTIFNARVAQKALKSSLDTSGLGLAFCQERFSNAAEHKTVGFDRAFDKQGQRFALGSLQAREKLLDLLLPDGRSWAESGQGDRPP